MFFGKKAILTFDSWMSGWLYYMGMVLQVTLAWTWNIWLAAQRNFAPHEAGCWPGVTEWLAKQEAVQSRVYCTNSNVNVHKRKNRCLAMFVLLCDMYRTCWKFYESWQIHWTNGYFYTSTAALLTSVSNLTVRAQVVYRSQLTRYRKKQKQNKKKNKLQSNQEIVKYSLFMWNQH